MFPRHRLPDCIGKKTVAKKWIVARTDFPYLFTGAGRAIARVRAAADCLEVATVGLEADYHAYTGVISARAAIDGFACWLNTYLGINAKGAAVSLTQPSFWAQATRRVSPDLLPHLESLRRLAEEIDPYRQPAAHRDGLFVGDADASSFDDLTRPAASRRWVILRPERWGLRGDEEHAPVLLRRWASSLESEICACLDLAPEPP
jgi:hypothetical protein